MKFKGTLEFEVDISSQEVCEVLGTMPPEEAQAFREKLLTDPEMMKAMAQTMVSGIATTQQEGMKTLMDMFTNFGKLSDK